MTRNGTPVAELRPVSVRRFVPRAVIVKDAHRAPRIDAARFRADLDALVEACVDADDDVMQEQLAREIQTTKSAISRLETSTNRRLR